MTYEDKVARLREMLKGCGGVAIAFSGGVDSTLLAAVAYEELGDRAMAVTALSPTYPAREQKEAAELAASIGIRHETIESNELEIDGFAANPVNRCYYCKLELFDQVRRVAEREGLPAVADGTNADDLSDHRPGRRAGVERLVISPLLDAGMSKADIRQLSKELGLPTADKPAFACLASRVPYGSVITEDKLKAIDGIEEVLLGLGFVQVRVRHYGDTVRIEVEPPDIPRLCVSDTRDRVVAACKGAGFTYVTLDLEGYRTGSMNEVL